MDPITALGVAGSIVQLVDFGLKVVSKGNKIYKSGDGLAAENQDLEKVVNDLVLIEARLRQSLHPLGTHGPLPEDEQALADLGTAAANVAGVLLEQLSKAKAQGRFRRWKSLRQAIKIVTSKGDVDDLAKRLIMLRDQFSLRVLIGMKNKFDVTLVEQSQNYKQLHSTSREILHAMEDNHNSLPRGLESNASAAAERQHRSDVLVVKTGENVIASVERLAQKWEEAQEDSMRHSHRKLPHVTNERAILRSLLYPMIRDRNMTISEAHAKTFQWILHDPKLKKKSWSDFTSWLRCQNDTYWVNGKAGSGKSTLMKYLSTEPEVQRHLTVWADTMPLVRAHFFFWNLGTSLQKSQAGLLRSLLHQALSQQMHMIPQILPELWDEMSQRTPDFLQTLQESWHSWPVHELRQVFEDLFRQTTESVKFCFFVDGLDEYDGDHFEILSLLRKLSSNPHVKFCISSRPLLIFEQTFKGCPTLCLQDLTVDDIKLYAHDKFNEHKTMSRLHLKDPELTAVLITEIVDMSSGVFLWVTIVTRSLLEGLTNHDGISDLQRRLRKLPPELDDLFSLMLWSIKPDFYLEQASRLFQLVYHARSPPSTIQLSIADDDDTSLVLKAGFYPMPSEEVHQRRTSMTARLKSRCAGLLEVHRIRGSDNTSWLDRVQYLHLTVKEFLEKPAVWRTVLQCTSETTFNAHLSWLRASIFISKTCSNDVAVSVAVFQAFDKTICDAFAYAALAEDGTGAAQVALLDELERTVNFYKAWASNQSGFSYGAVLPIRCGAVDCFYHGNLFLSFAISHGLSLYVKAKLSGRVQTMEQRACVPLLEAATTHEWDDIRYELRLSTLGFLLQEGLDPNDGSRGQSPWRRALVHLKHFMGTPKDRSWFDACRLFLSYGAHPWETLDPIDSRNSLSALDVIRKAFPNLPLGDMEELESTFFHPGAMAKGKGQMSHKRKACDGEQGPSPARKRLLRSRGRGRVAPEYHASKIKPVPSHESRMTSFTERRGPRSWINSTLGNSQVQTYQRQRSHFDHATLRKDREFPERWQERDQRQHYWPDQREQGCTSNRYVQASGSERHKDFYGLHNLGYRDDTMYSRSRKEDYYERHWEHTDRTYHCRV